MRVLVDTNILVRLFQPSNPSSPNAVSAIHELKNRNFELVMVPQNLYELWVISTRAVALNGFGMSVSDTKLLQEKCIQQFRILRDERGIFDFWFQIVSSNQVIGKSAHDARLVAAMVKHSIQNILTFNVQDFKRYSQIKAFDPADILAGQLPSST
jgi:predicted nucleic acid-binding protein